MATLSAHDLRRVAVEAEVDPRTVRKVLAGGEVRDVLLRRIERALRTLKVTVAEGVVDHGQAQEAK
jgi:hypothetical protein